MPAAGGGHADRVKELGGRALLEDVARGTCRHQLVHVRLVVVARQRDDRRGSFQRSCGCEAVHPRHREIEDDDVRLQRGGALERGAAVACVGHDRHVGLRVHEQAQPLAHRRVIVDQEDPDHVACRTAASGAPA